MLKMEITENDLFVGEKVLITKNANFVIKLNDFKLKSLSNAIEKTMAIIGFANKEAIGGRLYLTNYRLIFKTHPINRLKGKFSIFLSTINSVKDTSVFISKKIELLTISQNYEFVIWGIPEFIQEIESTKQTIDKEKLKELISNNYEKIGQGFEHFNELDALVRAMPKITEVIQNPLSLSSAFNIFEIFEIIEENQAK